MSWADPAHTAARGSSRAPSEGWDMVGMISFYLSEIFSLTGNHLRS